jgi:DNA-binding NarL/FixJ family response regulator
VFRQGLAQLVNSEPDMAVCGAAGSAEEAARSIPRSHPDLVLVDLSLPGKSGLDFIKELRRADSKLKLLVVSMHDEAVYADRVLRAGGDGYIMKQEDPGEIIDAIRDVLAGRIYVSEEVLGSVKKEAPRPARKAPSRPLGELTDLELEILELLGHGKSPQEIGEQLGLSARQVAAACAAMRGKMKLKSSNALVRYAVCWVESAGV